MNTTKKLVIAVIALSLALVAFASVSLAWLVSSTQTVTNTFTAGKVNITLDESEVDEYGQNPNGVTTVGNEYKLVPGRTYIKDPTVHVQKESEPCYVYVEVVNPLAEIIDNVTIENQMIAKGWKQISGSNIWYYIGTGDTVNANGYEVDARQAQVDLDVFEYFIINGDVVTRDNIGTWSARSITITAYAVQTSTSFANAEAAWTATFGSSTETN